LSARQQQEETAAHKHDDNKTVVPSDMDKSSGEVDVKPVVVDGVTSSSVEGNSSVVSSGSNVDTHGVSVDALLPVCRTGASHTPTRINIQPINTMVQQPTTPIQSAQSTQQSNSNTSSFQDYPVMNTLQRRRQEQQAMNQFMIQTVAYMSIVWTSLINPFINMEQSMIANGNKSSVYFSPLNSTIFLPIYMQQLISLMQLNQSNMKYKTKHYNNISIDYWHKQQIDIRQHHDIHIHDIYDDLDEDSELQLAKHLSRLTLLEETPDDFRREVEYREMIANAA